MRIDAKLFLTVHHQQAIGHVSLPQAKRDAGERGPESYQTEVILPVAPVAGDVIIGVGATWRVKGRWLPINESWVGVQLVDIQVNPSDEMWKHCDGEYRSGWNEEDSGSIDEQLKEWVRS